MSNLFTIRKNLFPVSLSISKHNDKETLAINGLSLLSLAEQYGTPLYIYDRATLDNSVELYRQALHDYYPYFSGITYAGKAYLCTAIAQWARQQGLWIDCTGVGELSIASQAGVEKEFLLVHGVNKSQEDLEAALNWAGTLVVDNLFELERIVTFGSTIKQKQPDIWLRLRPGVAVDTHAHRQTGQDDSKFGMSPPEIQIAVEFCLQHNLPITGIHFHQGSHFHDPTPLNSAINTTLDLIVELKRKTGWLPKTISPGGGWGVAYHETELPHPPIEDYVAFISNALIQGIEKRNLPELVLQLEPGRSLIARGGVAIYQIGTVKLTSNRRWLLVDGGLSDNPRPALYGARYSALPVLQPNRPASGPTWIGGPYCESGDVLIENIDMPEIKPGEFIAVPVSGAYHLSMASNYNGARKPAVIWLDNSKAHLIQKRETLVDLRMRDQAIDFD